VTTILIWNNNQVGRGHPTTGHASLNIDDFWGALRHEIIEFTAVEGPSLPTRPDAPWIGKPRPVLVKTLAAPPMDRAQYPGSYVSWWPQKPPDSDKSTIPRNASPKPNFLRDLTLEKNYAPDHILRLTGLNEPAMKVEWTRIRSKENAHYRYYAKNCSTIVARVLRAGTNWTDRNPWYAHSELWTPLKVKRFAKNLGAKEVEWVNFCAEMRKSDSYPQIDEGNTVKRRSDAHGNPNTPARFVRGVDTDPEYITRGGRPRP